MSRSSLTWELVRNAPSWVPAQTTKAETPGVGPDTWAVTSPVGVSKACSSLRTALPASSCCFLRLQGCIYTKSSTPFTWGCLSPTALIGFREHSPSLLPQPTILSCQNPCKGLLPAFLPLALAPAPHIRMWVHTYTSIISYGLKPERSFQRGSRPCHSPAQSPSRALHCSQNKVQTGLIAYQVLQSWLLAALPVSPYPLSLTHFCSSPTTACPPRTSRFPS